MKGLLLKDFYEIKTTLILLIVTIIGVGAGISYITNPTVVIIISALIMSNAVVGTIQTDKQSQWNKFTVTLPVSQSKIIASKYTLLIIFTVIGVTTGCIISLIFSMKNQFIDTNLIISYINLGFILSFISGSISIPLSFILSEDKGVVITLLAAFVTTVIIVLLAILFGKENMLIMTSITNIVSIILLVLSLKICSKILKSRDI